MIALTAVCTLAHFSFVLLLLGVLLGALGLVLKLVLVSLLLRWLLRFLFFLLNPPSNLQQPELGLWEVLWCSSSPVYLVLV